MKGVDSLIVIAAIAIFMAGVVVGMVLMALAAAAKRNNERIERAEKYDGQNYLRVIPTGERLQALLPAV